MMAFSVGSAAKVLDLSLRKVRELVATGEIPSFKIGASRRILRSELEAYLRRQAEATHPPAGPSTPPPPPGPKSEPLRRAG
jgi:excisionase family DNA binding protein